MFILRVLILSIAALGAGITKADSLAARDFHLAESLFSEGKESEALVSFTDFLRRHPNDLLADDAQFFIGEIYFRKRQFSEALNEFRKVGKYKKGNRVADAHLRMGEAHQRTGNLRAALVEFEAVRRSFPKSEHHDRAEVFIDGLLNPERNK